MLPCIGRAVRPGLVVAPPLLSFIASLLSEPELGAVAVDAHALTRTIIGPSVMIRKKKSDTPRHRQHWRQNLPNRNPTSAGDLSR